MQLIVDDYSIRYFINGFMNNQELGIYYFMFIILGIYLTIPVLSRLSDDKDILWYIVIVMFITKSILPVLFSLFSINYNYYLTILFDGYIIFVILGYLLRDINLSKKKRIILYVLSILSICIRYIGTCYLSINDGVINKLLFGYMQFHSVILACGVFVFIKNIKWNRIFKSNNIINIINKIASCSFGIYLIHIVVMYYVPKLLNINTWSIFYRTFGVFLTYIVSLVIVLILKKIPYINKIVP